MRIDDIDGMFCNPSVHGIANGSLRQPKSGNGFIRGEFENEIANVRINAQPMRTSASPNEWEKK